MFHAVTIGWATAHPLWGVHPISDFAPVGNHFQARRKFVRALRLPKSEKTMAYNHSDRKSFAGGHPA
jgi:hypothetical protein